MMIRSIKFMAAVAFVFSTSFAQAGKLELTIRTDRAQTPDGAPLFYARGETIRFLATLADGGVPTSAVVKAELIRPGRINPEKRDIRIVDGKGVLEVPAEAPGWVHLSAFFPQTSPKKGVKARDGAGALVDPFLIRPGAPRPADFDAFWDGWVKKTTEMPLRVLSRETIPLTEKQNPGGKFVLREFEINCVGPMPATGFYAMPVGAKPKSLPIIVKFQWAGGGILPELPLYYSDIAIFMTVGKFGAPYRLKDEKWASLGDIGGGYLHDKNILERDNAFLLWMILRDLRALQFAKSLPEWDGKTLVLVGESLGGAQSFILGALDQDVTFSCPCVPALADHGGQRALRRSGWPCIWKANEKGEPVDATNAVRAANAAYFDAANFAPRYRLGQEISVGTGLLDGTCPPESVLAAYNSLPTNIVRRLWVNPRAGHEAGNGHGGKRIEEIIGK